MGTNIFMFAIIVFLAFKLEAYGFYKRYFQQKQINAGRDPKLVIELEFKSRIWRLLLR